VPLSHLAREMGISPVSVNEMCRKLQDQGFAKYLPYKGATLTAEGERVAMYILRRHRLWEVFLVRHLGLSVNEAHSAACGLEHETSDLVAERLDQFLGRPRVSPEGLPVPSGRNGDQGPLPMPLEDLEVAQCGTVAGLPLSSESLAYLEHQGLRSGAPVCLLARSDAALLIRIGDQDLSVARELAAQILVLAGGEAGQSTLSLESKGGSKSPPLTLSLADLRPGQRGIVVRVSGSDRIRRRILEMGISPGVIIIGIRTAPLGDPIEFKVRGYHVSLRRSEAGRVTVQLVDGLN